MRLGLIAFLLSLISCEQKENKESFKAAFFKTTFDTGVIQKLYLYDSLRNIIISHIDTIFKFKNKTHFVFHADTNKAVREDDYSYRLNYYPDDVKRIHGTVQEAREMDLGSLQNMPAYIYPRLKEFSKK